MMQHEKLSRCANCRAVIPPGEQVYTLRVELFAAVEELDISEEDLIRDFSAEWDRLLEQMAEMPPDEVDEETDRVFERYTFTLCAACRERFHTQLRALQPRSKAE